VKRTLLVSMLTESGCVLHRHGGRHDIYFNPANGSKQPVPRHDEIADTLARHI